MLRIDAHHHLWRYTPDEYGWISNDMHVLRRDFLLADLQHELRTASVSGTVAVQARQTIEETEWLLSLASDNSPILGVVGWLPIAAQDFPAQLERFLAQPRLKGLRHVVQAEPNGFLDGSPFNQGIASLKSTSLVYDILIFARQLAEATRFVDRHPDQPFVLDHIAKPEIRAGEIKEWERGIRELAKRPNVACKVSGMVTEADPMNWSASQLKPYFDIVLETFTPNRLMIGTDWPVLTIGCTYAQWWRTVEGWTAPLSAHERAAILGDTAIRIYKLDLNNIATTQE